MNTTPDVVAELTQALSDLLATLLTFLGDFLRQLLAAFFL